MPKHLLDAAQVSPSLEQVGREGVPEDVGVNALRVESGLLSEPAQDEERACARERSALGVQEQVRSVAPIQVRPPAGEVAPQCIRGLPAERNDALLVPLAHAAHEAVVQVDASALEPDSLADAEARPVKKLDERAIAKRARRGPVRGADEAFDLGRGQSSRQSRASSRKLDLGRWVIHAQA